MRPVPSNGDRSRVLCGRSMEARQKGSLAMTNIPTKTDRVLAYMLTENTGRHFLDSGGAYGRHWQRNQGQTVDTLMAAPAVTVASDWVSLDVFHYLRARLSYDGPESRRFRRWATSGEWADRSWDECAKQWATDRHVTDGGGYDDSNWRGAFLSYNEDNLLSQDIAGETWTDADGRRLVLLQIHGGADIRGGFTEPRVFEVTTDDAWSLFDWYRFDVECSAMGSESKVQDARDAAGPMLPGMPERPLWQDVHAWSAQNASDWVDWGGSYVINPWKDSEHPFISDIGEGTTRDYRVMCPECGAPCHVYEAPTY